MSDNPIVYGHCQAGCKRRVPSYDDYKSIAAYIKISPQETVADKLITYSYFLELGNTYRIRTYNPPNSPSYPWGFSAMIIYEDADGQTVSSGEMFLDDYDKYANGIKLRFIAVEESEGNIYTGDIIEKSLVYEVNGQIRTTIFMAGEIFNFRIRITAKTGSTVVDGITYQDKLDVVMLNEDAQIVGKSAYDIAVEHGYKGTEEEWINSFKQSNDNQGNGNTGNDTQDPEIFLTNGTYGLSYSIDETEASCSSVGLCQDNNIEVGSMVRGIPVTSISDNAFNGCEQLESVTIPDSVRSVGIYAFSGCKKLVNVKISKSVTSIGGGAFNECTSLENVIIPVGVTSIEAGTFDSCSELKTVAIPNSVTSIVGTAFKGCPNLENIEANSNNEYYQSIDGNLYTKSGTTLVKYASGKIETKFNVLSDVTIIGSYAFDSAMRLTSVIIPNSVTNIGEKAFEGCSNLKSVYYTGTATDWDNISIGSSNDTLNNAIIYYYSESKPTSAGNYWLYVDGEIVVWVVDEIGTKGLEYALSDDESYYIVSGIGTITDTIITIPSSYQDKPVKSIGYEAFKSCKNLTSVTIGDGVTTIERSAFHGCENLTSVTIGNGVTTIGSNAFERCYNLTSVTIPDSVTSLGQNAFAYCTSLENVTIGRYVETIPTNTFGACTNLKTISVDEENEKYKSVENGAFLLTKDGKTLVKYAVGQDENTTIPDGIETIGSYAFENCQLTQIELPKSVKSINAYAFKSSSNLETIEIYNQVTFIGEKAFEGCSMLSLVKFYGSMREWESINIADNNDTLKNVPFEELLPEKELEYELNKYGTYTVKGIGDFIDEAEITIPSSYKGKKVSHIGYEAFKNCTNITDVTIGDGVSDIGYYAFEGCSNLKSIKMTDMVKTIGGYAFKGCSGLTDITLSNSLLIILDGLFEACSSLTSITLPPNIHTIYRRAFYKCTKLTSISIPEYIQTIGESAFCDCESLTQITLPTLTTISRFMFGGCISLKEIDIVSGITSIDEYAFYNCESLETVTMHEGLKSIGKYAFNGCKKLYNPTIPHTVESIGAWSFTHCESMTRFTIPTNITVISAGMFASSGLSQITIPTSITTIEASAFSGCTSLSLISLPKNVKTIETRAFNNCTSLANVYYEGYVFAWNDITISYGNEPLKNAERHYYKYE